MKMQYIEKIKKNITISASRKTTNLLDGLYHSVFKGRSLDFDDLREYVVGDNTKDIDWKSSIRHGSLLVRRFVAFRKHNIVFVMDCNPSFQGLTAINEEKREVSLFTYGTLAYLVNKNEDEISTIYYKNDSIFFSPFKTGLSNIEITLNELEKHVGGEKTYSVNDMLQFALKYSKRKMIFVVISDLAGMNSISENVLKQVVGAHDLLFINISDTSIYGNHLYDLDEKKNIPRFISSDENLKKEEERIKKEIYGQSLNQFRKYRVSAVTIDSKKEIINSIIDLLERHNHAVRR